MNTVNKPFRKKDAMQLVTGQPVYMDDLVPADCLIVKLLRSPHANAIVKSINTAVAKKVPGIEAKSTKSFSLLCNNSALHKITKIRVQTCFKTKIFVRFIYGDLL